jgi:phosphocarrier protein
MQNIKLTIINPLGLHARAASKLVSTATNFASDIRIKNDQGVEADGKRIMS